MIILLILINLFWRKKINEVNNKINIMTCRISLFNDNNYSVIKSELITKETYQLCEEEVIKRNEKVKYPKRWKLTEINV
jgi:hypothetical protein